MEEVLAVRTLMGLSVVKELSDTLKSSVETQRALAQKVSPYQSPVDCHYNNIRVNIYTCVLNLPECGNCLLQLF